MYKVIYTFIAVFLISNTVTVYASSSSRSTKDILQEIADNAEVANGSTEVKEYNAKTLDVSKELSNDLKVAQKHWDGCGPFKTTTYRRDSIRALEEYSHDQKVIDALMHLYQEKKISKSYSISTNHNVECSQIWVEIFTTDGYRLSLWYGLGD